MRQQSHQSRDYLGHDSGDGRSKFGYSREKSVCKRLDDTRSAFEDCSCNRGDELSKLRNQRPDSVDNRGNAAFQFVRSLLVACEEVGKSVRALSYSGKQLTDHAVLQTACGVRQLGKAVLKSSGSGYGFVAHNHAVVLSFLLQTFGFLGACVEDCRHIHG